MKPTILLYIFNNCAPARRSATLCYTRLAVEELASEAARGAERSQTIGPTGWLPMPRTNKRFLHNTIRSAVTHNRRQTTGGDRDRRKDEVELDAIIAAGNRRERRLLNDTGEHRYSFRKPKRDVATDTAAIPKREN